MLCWLNEFLLEQNTSKNNCQLTPRWADIKGDDIDGGREGGLE